MISKTSFGWIVLVHFAYFGLNGSSDNNVNVLAYSVYPVIRKKNVSSSPLVLFSSSNQQKATSRSVATAVLSPPIPLSESRVLKKNPSSDECSSSTRLQPIIRNEESSQDDDTRNEPTENEYESDDIEDDDEDDMEDDCEDEQISEKSAAGKAALERERKKLLLLGRNQRSRQRIQKKSDPSSSTKVTDKPPPRRTLSAASRARSSTSMPSSAALLKGIRTAAAAAAAASKRSNDVDDEKQNGSQKNVRNQKRNGGLSSMTKSVIQSTINYMLQTQPNTSDIQRSKEQEIINVANKTPHEDPFGVSKWYLEYDSNRKNKVADGKKQMGVLGEPIQSASMSLAGRIEKEEVLIRKKELKVKYPGFGHVLVPPIEDLNESNKEKSNQFFSGRIMKEQNKVPSSAYSHKKLVRVATPKDDVVIANLRMSVFSGFNNELRQKFCLKSCQVLHSRRMRGATCLVATCRSPDNNNKEIVLGSAECSTHEFSNTEIGNRRNGGSVMYITEFAVHPKVRGSGTGTMLLKAIDELAKQRNVETLYLHVDVTNDVACHLYKKAGYIILDKSSDPIFEEFTTSLNLHDGATKGRNHFLMYKNLVSNPTWLESTQLSGKKRFKEQQSILGFQIPQ